MRKSNLGFTLIELLIVVAIIAILAAIAVPNFLEAQTRSKVSRVRSDMRSAATAIEAYQIDWNKYPYDGYNRVNTARWNYWFLPLEISTPVAYFTTAKVGDPFRTQLQPDSTAGRHWQWNDVRYRNVESTWGSQFDSLQGTAPTKSAFYDEMLSDVGGWIMNSVGPDFSYGPSGNAAPFVGAESWQTGSGYPAHTIPYDPTNGTISWGDIMRSQKAANGYVNAP